MPNSAVKREPTNTNNINTTFRATLPDYKRVYNLSLAVFLISLTIILLALVEMRRGFLFGTLGYLQIGAPTPILNLNLRQLPLLMAGILGAGLSYWRLSTLEKSLRGDSLKNTTRLVSIGIFLLLVADLFMYRGVPAYRIATIGKLGVGQAIPVAAFPAWAQPVREGLNYLALVWHATFLAVLLGGLFLTIMAGRLKTWLSGNGFKTHLMGAALAVPQPFCSCCSAPIGATLYRQGASLGTTLAFVVSSPMLNVSGLLLAFLLLPGEFAFLRLVGGVVVGVFVTYIVSALAARWINNGQVTNKAEMKASWLTSALERYSLFFDFQNRVIVEPPESPAAFIANWLKASWQLGRVIIPVVLIGSVVTAAIVHAIPSPQNNLLGIIAAAAFGTLIMVPTWTEIPIANQLIKEGLTGPAATLLVTLPAVSVPCLAVISGAIANLRVSVLLGLAVFAMGIGAGVIFLLI